MSEFKKGDRVLIRKGSRSIFGVPVPKDVPATIKFEADRDGDIFVVPDEPFEPGQSATHDYGFKAADLLPITVDPEPAPPHWGDVEAGDTVTVRVNETGQEITTEAQAADRRTTDPDKVRILGRYFKDGWTLLSVVKAKKPLPTDNGAVIKVVRSPKDDGINLHLLAGIWLAPLGNAWTKADILQEEDWERVL